MQQQLIIGTLLHGGTYKIEKILGQGSFGITYLAEHTNLGKKVAIKEFFMKELNSRVRMVVLQVCQTAVCLKTIVRSSRRKLSTSRALIIPTSFVSPTRSARMARSTM